MARTFPDFHVLPQVILRYVQKLNPPVLRATSHSRGPSFPQTQRLQRFKLRFQFKNRMFLKASLAGQIYQSGCKKFRIASPALDQRSKEPCSRLRAPCPCKQQAVSEMTFTTFHVPCSAFPGHGSQPLMCSSRTARRLQQCHHHGPLHCTWDRDSPPAHIPAPISQHSHSSSTLKHTEAQGPLTQLSIQVSCPGWP